MGRWFSVFLLSVFGCSAAVPQQAGGPPAAPKRPAAASAEVSPTQQANDRYEQMVAERIAGREFEPAKDVFKNIQIEWLKDIPAARLLTIMNAGYSRSLGVKCTHCHVEQDFSSDEKRPKRAAREMAVMHRMVNQQLAQMKNLETPPDDRSISCIACHRGTINPNKTE